MDRGPTSWDISPEGQADSSNKSTEIGKEKTLNVYTNSQYMVAMIHGHGANYREGGLLTAEGKATENK